MWWHEEKRTMWWWWWRWCISKTLNPSSPSLQRSSSSSYLFSTRFSSFRPKPTLAFTSFSEKEATMTLLETIIKASIDNHHESLSTKYPIALNPDKILCDLKPLTDDSSQVSLIKPVEGWKISETDSQIIQLVDQFSNKLKRKLKKIKTLGKDEFLDLLNSFLEKIREMVGKDVGVEASGPGYTRVMLEKVGFLMGRDVGGLIAEACVGLELWEVLETLIEKKLVGHLAATGLIESLIEKKRSDLLCLCVKHFSEIQLSDFRLVLMYFIAPPKGAYRTMGNVRKEWENQALLAVEKTQSKELSDEKLRLAKQASILLMIAYDGFSTSELCMHYLFASSHCDELTLSNSIRRLNGSEMLKVIGYLGKWVRKYERIPQAGPCPEVGSALELRACEFIPSLETVVRCIGVVLDERFSSLVLSTEFHEELRSLEEAVKSLAAEAKLCCLMADVVENLKVESEVQ